MKMDQITLCNVNALTCWDDLSSDCSVSQNSVTVIGISIFDILIKDCTFSVATFFIVV